MAGGASLVAAREVKRRGSRTRDPLVAYHELLEDPVLAAESAAMLTEGQRERRLVFGDRPLCVSLRPNLISDWQYRAVNTAAETVYAALGRLERALLSDEVLRRELDLDPEEEELALADPGFTAASALTPSTVLQSRTPNAATSAPCAASDAAWNGRCSRRQLPPASPVIQTDAATIGVSAMACTLS